jgi:Mlc titration factor MtfA (ptsG expression regulator)
MFGWLKRKIAPAPIAIDPAEWREATAPFLFMRGVTEEESARLAALCGRFLATKHFSGAAGHEITPRMRLQVAAQACILILELDPASYDGWSEIIVYPGQFAPEREVLDEDGVVHLTRDAMAGEAWLGGPVILSWEDVAMSTDPGQQVAGYNVVIHEFAHKLDMLGGSPNGFPPLGKGMSLKAWKQAFSEAFADFCKRVDAADRLAETDDGEALDLLPIDAYASDSPAEFFAVISEAFFETPELLVADYPEVYGQLRLFYRQDPFQRLSGEARRYR